MLISFDTILLLIISSIFVLSYMGLCVFMFSYIFTCRVCGRPVEKGQEHIQLLEYEFSTFILTPINDLHARCYNKKTGNGDY